MWYLSNVNSTKNLQSEISSEEVKRHFVESNMWKYFTILLLVLIAIATARPSREWGGRSGEYGGYGQGYG